MGLKFNLVGISGVAGAGKDYLFQYCKYILKEDIKKVSLADNLKADLDDFLKLKLGISAFTTDRAEKDLIRNIMVHFAKVRRIQTKGTYYTNKIQNIVTELILRKEVPFITDVRFAEFENDEIVWVKKNNGCIIHVSRLDKEGKLIPPANSEEEKNDAIILEKYSDLSFCWPTLGNLEAVISYMETSGNKKKIIDLLCN